MECGSVDQLGITGTKTYKAMKLVKNIKFSQIISRFMFDWICLVR